MVSHNIHTFGDAGSKGMMLGCLSCGFLAQNLPLLPSSLSNHRFPQLYHRTVGEVKKYSDALASGLIEIGIQPKSTILSWLPTDTAEYHILQLACARGGFVLATLPSTCTDLKVLSKVLLDSKAVSVFCQGDTRIPFEVKDENGNIVDDDADTKKLMYDDVYTKAMVEVMPSLVSFDYFRDARDSKGKIVPDEEFGAQKSFNFVNNGLSYQNKEFPGFQWPVQTGFDAIDGFYNYKHLMAFNSDTLVMYKGTLVDGKPIKDNRVPPPADGVLVRAKKDISFVDQELVTKEVEPAYLHVPKETDPLTVAYDETGKKGKVLDHNQALESEEWATINAILSKQYVEAQLDNA